MTTRPSLTKVTAPCVSVRKVWTPWASTLARLDAHGVQTFRTDTQGAVTFVSDGRVVTARPFLK